MVGIVVLVNLILLFSLVFFIVGRAVIKRQSILGRPPVPLFFFILAKILALTNLVFLLMTGLNINVHRLYSRLFYIDLAALAVLVTGIVIVFLSTVQLNNDLVFGLSSSGEHKLQTRGIYSLSRHPFYLGFLLILFSSCLLSPNYINILSFTGTWLIHHFIMIREEESLGSQYGEEYRQYAMKVKRYITL